MRTHLHVDIITGHGINVEDAADGIPGGRASTAYKGHLDVDGEDIFLSAEPGQRRAVEAEVDDTDIMKATAVACGGGSDMVDATAKLRGISIKKV